MESKNVTIKVVGAVLVVACSLANGAEWQPMDSTTTEYLPGVWGSASNNVYAVGDSGTILHYEGTGDWVQMDSPTSNLLTGVWGSSADDIWAVGSEGTILRRQSGGDWEVVPANMTSAVGFNAVWGSGPDDVYVVGQYHSGHGCILHWDGASWTNEHGPIAGPLGAAMQFNSVWGKGANEIYVVGHNGYSSSLEGVCYKYDGTGWSWQWSGSAPAWPKTRTFYDIWGAADELFVVGQRFGGPSAWCAEWAHYDGSNWTTQIILDAHALMAVWGSANDDVYVAGYNGKIIHYDGSTWSNMDSGTAENLHGIWGNSPDDVFAVGGNGTILHLTEPPCGPVAFWRFEEPSGSFVADSANGHHGIATTDVVPSTDVPGPPLTDYPQNNTRSRSFPGEDNAGHIEIPDHDDLDPTGDFTIELWMNQSYAESRKLLCKHRHGQKWNGSWQLELLAGTGQIQMAVYPTNISHVAALSNPGVIRPGQWQHVAIAYYESLDRFDYYVDGIPQGTGTFGIAGLILNTPRPLYIGWIEGDPTGLSFNGNMDEIQIWNECRTQEQVRQDMVASIPEPPCGPEMVCIPGGEFLMGDHHDGMGQSLPVHAVYINSFCISRYEVTNHQYCDYLNAAICQEPPLIEVNGGSVYAAGGSLPYCDTHGYDGESQIDYSAGVFSVRTKDGTDMSDHPMVEVSWYGAIAYCDYYCYRLPTEAEWEYAARCGEHDPYYRYPWGDSIDGSKANYWNSGDAYETGTQPWTTPVGDYSANGYGLYDVIGNVWEWCSDWFDTGYYSVSPYDNPQGPATGTYPVCRGCSWASVSDPAASCRLATRNAAMPDAREYHLGFRVVRGESTGPVAYWPFDGDANDASGNGHHGTVFGATLCEDRCLVPDGAYCFDGLDDYVDVADAPELDLTEDFTIAFWINAAAEWSHIVMSKHMQHANTEHGWGLFIERDDKLQMEVYHHTGPGNPKITWASALVRNKWAHVAVTFGYDSDSYVTYINGEEDASGMVVLDIRDTDRNFRIGTMGGSPTGLFEGSIDEVRIYNRALSACEIGQLIEDCAMPVRVKVDVKPAGCPNPLNLKSKGVLPVAVLGTEEFDVSAIDIASIRLAGVAPVRSSLEDVSAPVADGNECDCTEAGADGFVDLTLKFRTPEIVEELLITHGELARGDVLELYLTGRLSDGTSIEGVDCVVLVGQVPAWIAAKRADIDQDGRVNLGDLFELKKQWGKSSLPDD